MLKGINPIRTGGIIVAAALAEGEAIATTDRKAPKEATNLGGDKKIARTIVGRKVNRGGTTAALGNPNRGAAMTVALKISSSKDGADHQGGHEISNKDVVQTVVVKGGPKGNPLHAREILAVPTTKEAAPKGAVRHAGTVNPMTGGTDGGDRNQINLGQIKPDRNRKPHQKNCR